MSLMSNKGIKSGFTPILLANLLPLFGVLAFSWDAAMVVGLYVLELGLMIFLAAGKALFAARPPKLEDESADNAPGEGQDDKGMLVGDQIKAKRGSIEVVPWLPPVYPRNIGFAKQLVFGGTVYGFIFIVSLFADILAEIRIEPIVVLSAITLFAGQLMEVYRNYIQQERYKQVTPRAVVNTPFRQGFFLVFLLFIGLPISEVLGELVNAFAGNLIELDQATVGLLPLVVGKILIDWSAFASDRGITTSRVTNWLAGPTREGRTLPEISVPDIDPDGCVQINPRTVAKSSLFYGLWKFVFIAPWVLVLSLYIGGLFAEATGDWGWIIAPSVALLGIVLILGIDTLEYYLQYGHMEYYRYDGKIIGYDQLLEEYQWSMPKPGYKNTGIIQHRLSDRILGTKTIWMKHGWNEDKLERHIGPTTKVNQTISELSLPITSTKLRSARVPMAIAGGLVMVFFCGPAILLVASILYPETVNIEPGDMIGGVVPALFVFIFAMVGIKVWLHDRDA